jgi:hypothetical protein
VRFNLPRTREVASSSRLFGCRGTKASLKTGAARQLDRRYRENLVEDNATCKGEDVSDSSMQREQQDAGQWTGSGDMEIKEMILFLF